MKLAKIGVKRWILPVMAATLLVVPIPAQAQSTAPNVTPTKPSASLIALPARGASIVVKAEHFETVRQGALAAAQACGAELVHSRTQVTDKGRQHGDLQFRLPATALASFLTRLRSLGTLSGERLSTQEHGPEAASLAKRVQRLQEHEKRLGSILEGERRLRGSDILFVQERLFRASVDESLLLQRREDLERDGRLCNVVLTIFEPVEVTRTAQVRRDVSHSFAEGLGHARDVASMFTVRGLTMLAYLVVFAPLWIGASLLLWLGAWHGRRIWQRARIVRP